MEKSLIIYFSQTSNTLKIAEAIRDGVETFTGHCSLESISDVNTQSLSDFDLVGIGAPVFYYREPFNVGDFVKGLPELRGQNWFVFCTHGNIIGNFFPSITAKLEDRGATIIGSHHSFASITVPFYPRPSYTSGHPDRQDLDQARNFGVEMAELNRKIKAGEQVSLNTDYPASSEEWLQESSNLTKDLLEKVTPKLRFNADTCVSCGECADNCPVGGIDVESDPPRLQSPCIFCWRCVNICPTISITADWGPFVSMAPAIYARYKKELDKLTEQGAFRWLMDPGDVNFDDPLCKQRERELAGEG